MVVPASVIANAHLRGSEYAWTPVDFPAALTEAARLGFRCSGGQFQFRFADGTCEMYWIESNAPDREAGEQWPDYVARCESVVRTGFARALASTDFQVEAQGWPFIKQKIAEDRVDPMNHLVFVAYFEHENGETF